MKEILNLMPVLGIAMTINILLGMYYKIGKTKVKFDKTKLFNGVLKAAIVGTAFIGFAYIFTVVDLSSIGLTPILIMQVSIVTYATKGITNLAKIMGVQDINKNTNK